MTTIYVWVLLIYMSNPDYDGGPTIIDNISSQQECQRVAELFSDNRQIRYVRCIQIQKVKA